MITIYILILIILAIFFACRWYNKVGYKDPPDGTVYKYDTEDSEFSANQLEKKK